MARYLEIGTEIAHRVRSGQLPPGTQLPAIRETARTHATTVSTIGRAYRYLADGGVLTLADRRARQGYPAPQKDPTHTSCVRQPRQVIKPPARS